MLIVCAVSGLPCQQQLSSYNFSLQSHCQANLYGIGRNESLFENALNFMPERWLHDHIELGRLNNLASLAFGHGPRMCIGNTTH